MPLIKIPNQPLFSDPNAPTEEFCPGNMCHPVRTDDRLQAQFYQTPCGDNEACDADFTDVTYTDTYDTDFSACPPAGWTGLSAGTGTGGWECTGGGIKLDQTGTAPTGSTLCGVNPAGMTQYANYRLQFTVSGMTQGWVQIYLGTVANGVTTGQITANGTYTFYLTYLEDPTFFDDIQVLGSGSNDTLGLFDGVVDNIDLDDVALTCWDNGSGTWDITGEGGACKIVTGTGVLIDDVAGNYLTAGTYYKLWFTISGYVSGTVTPAISDYSGTAVSGNGTFYVYGTPTIDGALSFTPSSDFIGCIDSVDVRALKDDYAITLVDADTFVEVEDLTPYLTYYNEFITLDVAMQDLDISDGCYELFMYDTCDVQYGNQVPNSTFTGGSGYTCPNWQILNNGVQFDFSSNECEFIHSCLQGAPYCNEADAISLRTDKILTLEAGNYEVTFTIVSNTDAPIASGGTGNIGVFPSMDNFVFKESPVTFYKEPGTYVVPINNYDPATNGIQRLYMGCGFALLGVDTLGSIVIDNVELRRVEPYDATYESDCFMVATTWPNTKLFTGVCDNNQFGFEFENTGFTLSQRLECRALAPSWPRSVSQYTYSTGSTSQNYAQLEKYFDVFIEAVNATHHGTLAVQTICEVKVKLITMST